MDIYSLPVNETISAVKATSMYTSMKNYFTGHKIKINFLNVEKMGAIVK
jgi:hypothetical protein